MDFPATAIDAGTAIANFPLQAIDLGILEYQGSPPNIEGLHGFLYHLVSHFKDSILSHELCF